MTPTWALEIRVRTGATRDDLAEAYPDHFDGPVTYWHFQAGDRIPVLLNHHHPMIGMARAVSTPDGVRMFVSLNGAAEGQSVRDLLSRGGVPGVSLGMRVGDRLTSTGRSVPSAPVTEVSLLVDDQGRGVHGGFGTDAQVVRVDKLTLAEVEQRAADYADLRASGVAAVRRMERNVRACREWRHQDEPIQYRDHTAMAGEERVQTS